MKKYYNLFYPQLILQAIGIVVTLFITTFYFYQEFIDQTKEGIEEKLFLVRDGKLSIEGNEDLRITLIGKDGLVIKDNYNSHLKSPFDNHKDRPEVKLAFEDKENVHFSKRGSASFSMDFLYGTLYQPEGHVLRIAIPIKTLYEHFIKLSLPIFFFILPIMFFFIYLSLKFGIKQNERKQNDLDKLKEDLVANISHEVKTPMTTIKGHVELLKTLTKGENGPFLEKQFINSLKKIETNTDRLKQLFSDILDLTVIENNQNLTTEEISVEDLTSRVVQNLNQNYAAKKIKVVTEYQAEQMVGNLHTIEQLLNNLVDNAHKYMPIERENPTIKILWEKHPKGKIHLKVSDNGMGIKEKDLPRIFERFYRVDISRSRDMGGTGLGLAIVKHVVQKHNGTISVKSDFGKGTSFSVIF